VEIRIETVGAWPDAVAALLRDLPEWFGIEESVRGYIEAARTLPGAAAIAGDDIVGVCLVRRHTDVAAEIELLAVRRDLHRQAIGRRLLQHIEPDLVADGVRLLEVKTFGPSGDSAEYERTRAFYRACGFLPLEERTDIWSPENPCLISVKPLA
jgi:ribosomal protein S18 acetylase RimI-like enzyme